MKSQPDTEDARLILQLYELRREPRMREARDFVIGEMSAESFQDFTARYPFGTDKNAYFRMVTSYWEMAASFVNRGLLNTELFFETSAEFMAVWEKAKKVVPQMRELFKNPLMGKNLEELAQRYEEYMNERAPEYLPAWREMLKTIQQQRAAQTAK